MGEAEMRKPRLGSIYQRGNIWWVKYYRNGQVFRESSERSEYADAEDLLKKRNGEIVTGRFAGLTPERITVGTLFENLLDNYRLKERGSLRMTENRIHKHLMPRF